MNEDVRVTWNVKMVFDLDIWRFGKSWNFDEVTNRTTETAYVSVSRSDPTSLFCVDIQRKASRSVCCAMESGTSKSITTAKDKMKN